MNDLLNPIVSGAVVGIIMLIAQLFILPIIERKKWLSKNAGRQRKKLFWLPSS